MITLARGFVAWFGRLIGQPDAVAGGFDAAFEVLLVFEGARSSDAAGGETVYGISRANWPTMWKDGHAPSLNEAREFYRQEFWLRFRCDELPSGAALVFFLAAVNMGVLAVRALQEACAESGITCGNDGVMGSATIAAAAAACGKDPAMFMARLRGGVAYKHATLAVDNPGQRKFLRGWLIRDCY